MVTIGKSETIDLYIGNEKITSVKIEEDDLKTNGLTLKDSQSKKYYMKKCCDNFIGHIEYNNCSIPEFDLWFSEDKRLDNISEVKVDHKEYKYSKETEKIVIILESPHKDEYKVLLPDPLPAIGGTGRKLHSFFPEVFLKSGLDNLIGFEKAKYEVILMNIIQYQCSLGASTKLYRDRVFKELWKNKFVYDSFENRLKQYNPRIIMNLSTDIGKIEAKKALENINKNELGSILIEGPHPSSWNIPRLKIVEMNNP
ncbi:MAG: hypothetical protein RBQ97_09980 [Acholeplasma sp.]|nr:hypothetical protein [Acholeplasma sp.]